MSKATFEDICSHAAPPKISGKCLDFSACLKAFYVGGPWWRPYAPPSMKRLTFIEYAIMQVLQWVQAIERFVTVNRTQRYTSSRNMICDNRVLDPRLQIFRTWSVGRQIIADTCSAIWFNIYYMQSSSCALWLSAEKGEQTPIHNETHWTHCLVWVSRVTWHEAQAQTLWHNSACCWNLLFSLQTVQVAEVWRLRFLPSIILDREETFKIGYNILAGL